MFAKSGFYAAFAEQCLLEGVSPASTTQFSMIHKNYLTLVLTLGIAAGVFAQNNATVSG